MVTYLNPELVCNAFNRLSSRNQNGKSHKERTSILMYFLAFDATCKHFGVRTLDLDPNKHVGKDYRRRIGLEFTKLVLVEHNVRVLKQVSELGKIEIGGTEPEKRISSNFLTVPVKKASRQQDPYFYPGRPAPLLTMGSGATEFIWGVTHHKDWSANISAFFSETRDSTPFLDLAIFVCRDYKVNDSIGDIVAFIISILENRFTQPLSQFWIKKINQERRFARHLDISFVNNYSSFVNHCDENITSTNEYENFDKGILIKRILQLEELLFAHNIQVPDIE